MNEGPIAHNILDFLKNSTTSPMSLSSSATLLNAETQSGNFAAIFVNSSGSEERSERKKIE